MVSYSLFYKNSERHDDSDDDNNNSDHDRNIVDNGGEDEEKEGNDVASVLSGTVLKQFPQELEAIITGMRFKWGRIERKLNQ